MLSDLIQYAYEVTGIKPDNTQARAQLLRAINRAAGEIYSSADLPGSLHERTFTFDSDSGIERLITLPWNVESVRAARLYEFGPRIRLESIAQKYAPHGWHPPFLTWRVYHRSPLSKTLAQASQLRFTIAAAETTPLNITVDGQTANAARTTETVTIDAGDTTVTTTNQWLQDSPDGIVAIVKDRVTTSDVVIESTVDDEEVGKLYNRALFARNVILQITDDLSEYSSVDNTVELLYKRVFYPFYYDTDMFCEPQLEDAIVWKMREHWYSQKAALDQNEIMTNSALLANRKCADLVTAVCATIESERKREVINAPNPYMNAPVRYANIR